MQNSVKNTLPQKFSRHLKSGVHRFIAFADASCFDWEQLYFPLYKYGNQGQRTGPWDFDLRDENLGMPLIPSYWVYLNDVRLGLWYWQRPSLENLRHQYFQGTFSFFISEPGNHHLRLVPYRDFRLNWLSHRIEADADNALQHGWRNRTAAIPGDFWEKAVAELQGYSQEWMDALKQGLNAIVHRKNEQWVRAPDGRVQKEGVRTPEDLRAMYAHYRVFGAKEGLEEGRTYALDLARRPYWGGKEKEESYGRDGDMGAALPFRALAEWLRDAETELEEEEKAEILKKLTYQGRRFFELSLLNQDYWGGSLLQDHGWRAHFDFATGCLLLEEKLKEAALWLDYAIPRVMRALEAMPRDGVIPPSSYHNLRLYTWEATRFRDAFLWRTGRDIFIEYPFAAIVDYLDESCSPHDLGRLHGGNGFLRRIGVVANRETAFYWESLLESHLDAHGRLDAVLSGIPRKESAAPEVNVMLRHYADSGLAIYHQPENNVKLSVHCGPWLGFHAYEKAPGPCDRMSDTPAAGHFNLSVNGEDYFYTPDSAYSMQSVQRTGVLIDGKGPLGDIGYPMSLPAHHWAGQKIQRVAWDTDSGSGEITLDLKSLFPDSLRLLHFTRSIRIIDARNFLCEDWVVSMEPHFFSWVFQGDFEPGGKPSEFVIQKQRSCVLTLKKSDLSLIGSVQPTPVVFGYTGSGRAWSHVRWDAGEKRHTTKTVFGIQLL